MPSGSQFANNAATTIVSAITSVSTEIQVAGGTTDLFPEVSNGALDIGSWFYATLFSSATVYEIVKVTSRLSGDPTWSILRGQEGTTAQSWPAGTAVELRITAAGLSDYRQPPEIQNFTVVGSSQWIKPKGAQLVHVLMYGGGGGGGGGNGRVTSGVGFPACGGAGGSAGSRVEFCVVASALSATVPVTVGQGGTSGIGNSWGNGVTGGTGGNSTFNTTFIAAGGNGGFGGADFTTSAAPSASNSAPAATWSGNILEGRGGGGTAGGNSTSGSVGGLGPGGGGGGGGYQANNTNVTGGAGAGGIGGASIRNIASAVGGVSSGSTAPGSLTGGWTGGSGGVGGAAGGNPGGNGGWPGGGGGGGGASHNGTSGAGGKGGDGYVRITTFF